MVNTYDALDLMENCIHYTSELKRLCEVITLVLFQPRGAYKNSKT